MRTTITLDDDVAAKLAAEARRTGQPFKRVVNETLRAGLATKGKTQALPPFKILDSELFELPSGYNWDKLEDVFDQLDGPDRLR